MNILKEFSRQATLAYARTREPREYLGRVLFPDNTVNELTFEYFKDLNLLPVAASVQAFGAEAEIASREGIKKVSGEIPTIKRKIPLSGRALIALRREGAGDEAMVRDTLFNDLDNMIDACQARQEMMRMDAVANGKIVLAENGVIMTVDYGVPATHKKTITTATEKWSHASSTPIQDIQAWMEIVTDTSGITPSRALTSTKIVGLLLKNPEVRQLIYGDNGGSRAISLAQLNALFTSMGLPTIVTYDTKVRRQLANGKYTTSRLFPEEKFVLLPGEALGESLVGPTEDAMLDADVATEEIAGVYAAVYKETMDPPVIMTKAALTTIPTFPLADAVFQAKVI